MKILEPKLSILQAPQLEWWDKLIEIPKHFTLYGGTALALQLGHRYSIDFDFFTAEEIINEELIKSIPFLENICEVLQSKKNTMEVVIQGEHGVTKFSFFGDVTFGQLNKSSIIEENQIKVASIMDIFAWKIKTICSRIEIKDFQDIAEILRSGYTLEEGVSGANSLFKSLINTMHPLKALDYLDIEPLELLSIEDKKILKNAATNINFGKITNLPTY
jgi:hypothetical protein